MKISNVQENPQFCPSFIKRTRGQNWRFFLDIANFHLKVEKLDFNKWILNKNRKVERNAISTYFTKKGLKIFLKSIAIKGSYKLLQNFFARVQKYKLVSTRDAWLVWCIRLVYYPNFTFPIISNFIVNYDFFSTKQTVRQMKTA